MEVEYLVVDVIEKDVLQCVVDLVLELFGWLDCLVNNVGFGFWVFFGDIIDQMIDDVLNISLKVSFCFVCEVFRVMQFGVFILNIGFVFGLLGGLDGGIYCMVKVGMIGMSQVFVVQYGVKGICFNVVVFGVVKIDMIVVVWDYFGF